MHKTHVCHSRRSKHRSDQGRLSFCQPASDVKTEAFSTLETVMVSFVCRASRLLQKSNSILESPEQNDAVKTKSLTRNAAVEEQREALHVHQRRNV